MAARNMEEEQSLRECEAYVQMHDIQKILKAAFESLKTLSWFFFLDLVDKTAHFLYICFDLVYRKLRPLTVWYTFVY